jgi:hypothetical protein
MAELDMGAVQAEFEGLSGTDQPTAPVPEETPMFELPYGDQTYKFPLNHEIPIKHNGQVIKAPFEKVLNAFRERSHLQDHRNSFNAEKETFESERQKFGEFQDLHKKYGEIQDWSEKNPDQWEKLWNLYQSKETALLGDPSGEASPVNPQVQELLQSMQQQIRDLSADRDARLKSEEERAVNDDVKAVESEIANFRDTFGEKYGINLEEANEDGVTLQSQILKFGIDKGYQDFETAATMYLRDTLLDTAQHTARTETAKGIQQDTRAGIISRSDTPSTGETSIDPTKLTEDQLMSMAFDEMSKKLNTEG